MAVSLNANTNEGRQSLILLANHTPKYFSIALALLIRYTTDSMVLSDKDIREALRTKHIVITPAPDLDVQLGSCSLDLRLGRTFRVFNQTHAPFIDLKNKGIADDMMREIVIGEQEPFILEPGDFVLAVTMETIEMPDDLIARLEGRSSLGRLGIVVHSTASVVDPGMRGTIVLELGNHGKMPVALYSGMRICALTFEELKNPAEVPYHKKKNAKYIGQSTPEASKIGEE